MTSEKKSAVSGATLAIGPKPVVNLINQAKSMPNLTRESGQAELANLLKAVGLNRSLKERAIKVFPRSAWKTLIFWG